MDASLTPTSSDERIGVLDVLRGVAVLGILLLNIIGFGLPYAYEDPTNWGGAEGANLAVWHINSLFFEGTMRGLFTLLFGAGALLFLERHFARGQDRRPATLYFRRMLWLIAFGLINGYVLLWDGDILFYYGVVGLGLYFFRTLSTRKLLVATAIVLCLQVSISILEYVGYVQLRDAAEAAASASASGIPLTIEQNEAIDELTEVHRDFKPTQARLEAVVDAMRESYASAFLHIGPRTWYVQTAFFVRYGLADALSMMLLGMALLRMGILTGAAPTRTYVRLVLIGYAVGLTVNAFEVSRLQAAQFDIDAMMASYLTYDLGRIPMTLGHVGSIVLLYRLSARSAVSRVLAAAGRMALTNYLSQSVICLFLFTGAGFALYGRLERHELYYIVLAIWTVQLAWSALWLRQFQFGPAEWLWRSLTYGRRPPMHADAPPPKPSPNGTRLGS